MKFQFIECDLETQTFHLNAALVRLRNNAALFRMWSWPVIGHGLVGRNIRVFKSYSKFATLVLRRPFILN